MLAQAGGFAEGLGGIGIFRVSTLIPAFWLQRVDAVHTAHQIHETAADPLAHILLLMFHIQRYDGFACL